MFSKLLLDPYFHNDYNEQSAKNALSKATKENFLFCPCKNEHEIVLVYKAEYQHQIQVRSITLSYSEEANDLSHDSLGTHSSFYAVGQALIPFLKGWTTKIFSPLPFLKLPFSPTGDT